MPVPTFDEELDNVVPQKAPVQQPVAQTAPAQAAAPAAAPAPKPTPAPAKAVAEDFEDEETQTPATKKASTTDVADNCDTDFDDEDVYKRTGQLDQCRPGKKGSGQDAARFSFLPKEWAPLQKSKTHFLETPGKEQKRGRYRCLSPVGSEDPGYCCTRLKADGDTEVVGLVLRYTNADPQTGKYTKQADGSAPPIQWAIQFVRLSQFNMKQIKKLPDEEQTPYDIDLLMTHAEGRAFGYEFSRIGSKARWLQNPQLVAEVKAAVAKFTRDDNKLLKAKLGKKFSLMEWKALLSGLSTSAEEASMGDVDDL